MTSLISWIFQAFLLTVLYFGYYENMKGAQNIIIFWCWLLFIIYSSSCFNPEIGKLQAEGRANRGKYICPEPIVRSVDAAIIFSLIWYGSVITAVALIATLGINYFYFKEEMKKFLASEAEGNKDVES